MTESQSQIAMVKWFRLQYPKLSPLLFHVPNGRYRSKTTARMLKAEGVVAGVSDLILLIPNSDYHGLLIEVKSETGRQTPLQKMWGSLASSRGYRYEEVRS